MKTIGELRNVRLREALGSVNEEIGCIAGEGARLIVFGSHARGEERADSDVDLMVVLPDEMAVSQTMDSVRNVIYDAGLELDMHLSVMVVSESQAKKHSGFMVFGSVEREGIAV
jgi:uncharacterized protein